MANPIVKMEGIGSNAFRLLARAKKALREAGWSAGEVATFADLAGQADVVRYAGGETPASVYDRLMAEVRDVCLVR